MRTVSWLWRFLSSAASCRHTRRSEFVASPINCRSFAASALVSRPCTSSLGRTHEPAHQAAVHQVQEQFYLLNACTTHCQSSNPH